MADGFLVLLFIFSAFSTNIHACSQTESSSLQSFALTLSASTPLNWTTSDCCRWEGITCNPGGLVTHLSLPSKGLKLKGGSLDKSTSGFFLSLTHLEVLDLSYNLLSGELPLSLPFRYIRVLDLSNNRIKGTIPSSFLQHAWNLSSLNVSNNHLTGQIPSSLCLHSSSVRLLDFSFNEFSGIFPPGLLNCSKLEVLRAGFNDLSGPLPSDIYNIPTLQEISLPSNKLFGPVSNSIVNLTKLRILELYFNKLTGSLPLDVGKLSKLRLLILNLNDLQGSLPPSLMNCTALIELNLGFNQLGGDISKLNFSRLTRLSKLDLVGNCFTGTLPISLYSCKSLKALRLSGNNLEGQIKPEMLSLKSLSFLSLAQNRLTNVTGAMQILMGSKSLTVLILSLNFFGEEMPDGDGMIDSAFQNLRLFSLSSCQLTGPIPLWLSKLKKLEILNLSSNRVTGTIPGWLGTLPNLFNVILRNNSLSGEFPKELCRLQALVSPRKAATQTGHGYFELPTYSQFERTNASITPLEYKNLSNMPTVIDIMNNSLSGRIPTEIGQLQLLQKLDLSLNNLLGGIPNQISYLTNLERLDLSRNQLSGAIPASLSSLHFLSSFAVAYNNLQGQIPSSTQLQGLSATAFEGNPGLCGAPLPINCEQMNRSGINNRTEDVHNGSVIPWWHISVALGFITGFWGVCGPLVLSRSWRCVYFQFLYGIKDKVKNMVPYGRM
ncbi:putative non-specific serine/threonine protein kinase [Rosa chinensis]|uniref:Putative non-specific serine/threonine protein kinase n=1 Tax=Rosa chinensis TaxID=74649 RepID=A0A2P6QMR0_ROSCH|nr:putative non-specific serine/threonine protein kinase [Rosa chinensis]